jgi:hypothetical protein
VKYLCLIYYDEKVMETMSKGEWDRICEAALVYEDELRTTGRLIAAQALQPVQTATTLRVRSGKISMMDGPFAETKEQLGGFFLITVRDLNEAIQVAAKIPPAVLGSVEVRPIRELTES